MQASSPAKNKCMMNCAGVVSTLLLLITGFVLYSYTNDPKETADGFIIALTLIMNIGGSLFCLVSVGTKNYVLYTKLKKGLYAAIATFTVAIVVYCFVIISRGMNYDDLVALLICYVMFLVSYICALQLYNTDDEGADSAALLPAQTLAQSVPAVQEPEKKETTTA